MNKLCSIQLILLISSIFVISCKSNNKSSKDIIVSGDYQLLTQVSTNASIYFSGSDDYGYRSKLIVSEDAIEIRQVDVKSKREILLKRKDVKNTYPVDVRILKNGNYFRIWVGDNTEWIRGPLGEWKGVYEPLCNHIQGSTSDGVSLSIELTSREWLTQSLNEAIKYGPTNSFYEQQIIPGAILEYDGKYYIYFMAGMVGDEEGSSRRTIGVAVSKNFIDWEVNPEPVVTYKDYPYDNLYINGVAITPDNKIAIMFSAQDFPRWEGIMLAISDTPDGTFRKSDKQPVYKHDNAAHEFDLIDMKKPLLEYKGEKYRYMLFYAGFAQDTSNSKAGDKGFIIYSNDLKDWVYRDDNPVFYPETKDNWDGGHVRPRSLTMIDGCWYLWYEGCNRWTPPGTESDIWCDVIGLARSKDLVNWEYHPRNPVLSGLGIDDVKCGSSWVGWPRMIIKDQICYVFFCGMHDKGKVSLTFRTIPISKLVDWESDLVLLNNSKD